VALGDLGGATGLAKQGCTFKSHKGGSGHLTVFRGECGSQLPMHGGSKE